MTESWNITEAAESRVKRKYVRHVKPTWEELVAAAEKIGNGHVFEDFRQLTLPLKTGMAWHANKRQRSIRRATPVWANRRAISAKYAEAKRLTAETGIPHSVDHVIPLHHAQVCGLHVHANMRVIETRKNSEKHNFWPVCDR